MSAILLLSTIILFCYSGNWATFKTFFDPVAEVNARIDELGDFLHNVLQESKARERQTLKRERAAFQATLMETTQAAQVELGEVHRIAQYNLSEQRKNYEEELFRNRFERDILREEDLKALGEEKIRAKKLQHEVEALRKRLAEMKARWVRTHDERERCRTWFVYTDDVVLNQKERLKCFPLLPSMVCEYEEGNEGGGGGGTESRRCCMPSPVLGTCKHRIRRLYGHVDGVLDLEVVLLKRARLFWHPDRFGMCSEEVKAGVMEFSQMVNALYEEVMEKGDEDAMDGT